MQKVFGSFKTQPTLVSAQEQEGNELSLRREFWLSATTETAGGEPTDARMRGEAETPQ